MAQQTPENILGSGPITGLRKTIYQRWKKLEEERSSWRTHWMEISDYIAPRRGKYLLEGKSTRGRKRSNKIIDNTATHALRTLGAGMMSGMTSPARPWFKLETPNEQEMDLPGVRKWLGDVEAVLRRLFAGTNFYNSAHLVYTELGAFGTGPLFRRRHPERGMHYRNFTAGEFVIAENEFNEVDTLGRNINMTVSQVVQQFVWNQTTQKPDWHKVSNSVHSLWNKQQYDEELPVIHMIQPRRAANRIPGREDGPNRAFMDVYIEEGADTDVVLRESGWDRFPAYVPRWDSGDVYGKSPAMDSLGDVKQLQHEQKRKAQAIDKMVNPPMVADPSLKGKPTTTLPGGNTYVNGGQAGFQPAYLVAPRIAELNQDIAEVQERIQRGFYADLFAMMINSDRRNITATEVVERHEEKLVLLGPVLQRLNVEFLTPLIDDMFDFAIEQGLLPPPPEALQGIELKIKYIGLLAQAQEAVAATSIERGLSFAGNMAGVFPGILDNIDPDEAIRSYNEILGTPANIIRDSSAVEEIRLQRAEAQQQEAAMAQAGEAAQTAKLLSEADTQTPNALTAMLQGTGGGARSTV